MIISLNGDGCILVQYNRGNGVWLPLCAVHLNPDRQRQKPMFEDLSSLHLSQLRKIHPKRAGEVVRMLAKKHMLPQSEEPTKKWWKFW